MCDTGVSLLAPSYAFRHVTSSRRGMHWLLTIYYMICGSQLIVAPILYGWKVTFFTSHECKSEYKKGVPTSSAYSFFNSVFGVSPKKSGSSLICSPISQQYSWRCTFMSNTWMEFQMYLTGFFCVTLCAIFPQWRPHSQLKFCLFI